MRKNHKKHIEKRLKRLRMIMYTTISLAIIETSGIFSLAKEGLLYVQSNALCNAFSPTTYVDIQINEPNGDIYYINSDGGHAISTSNGKYKIAEIENPAGTTKKPVLARARVVAMIYSENGILQGTTQSFVLNSDTITSNVSEKNKWYNDTSNGYYYFTNSLNPGDRTILFKDVSFTDVSNIPEDGYVEIHVLLDTIEVDLEGTDGALAKNKANIADNWKSLPSKLWETYLSKK